MTQIDRINGLIGSIAVKAPCRVATTANITLSGEQTIDDVAVVAEDRILVKNQTITSENGIYDCSVTSWIRATDFNGARDFTKGTLVRAIEGTANANINFEVISSGTTIDVSSIVFNGEIITSDVTYYDNIASLRAITTTPSITNATTKGYTTDNDGGQGDWYWDSSSTEVDDNGIIIKATAITTGRWKRLFVGAVSSAFFGTKGDGATTDNTTAFHNWSKYLNTNKVAGRIPFTMGYYKITQGFVILSDVNVDTEGAWIRNTANDAVNFWNNTCIFFGTFFGGQDTFYDETSYDVNNITASDRTITLSNAGDGLNFSAGSIGLISDPHLTTGATTPYNIHEHMNEVISVSGDVLTLKYPVKDTYTADGATKVQIYKETNTLASTIIPSAYTGYKRELAKNSSIKNLRLTQDVDTYGQVFHVSCYESLIKDIDIEGASGWGINPCSHTNFFNIKTAFRATGFEMAYCHNDVLIDGFEITRIGSYAASLGTISFSETGQDVRLINFRAFGYSGGDNGLGIIGISTRRIHVSHGTINGSDGAGVVFVEDEKSNGSSAKHIDILNQDTQGASIKSNDITVSHLNIPKTSAAYDAIAVASGVTRYRIEDNICGEEGSRGAGDIILIPDGYSEGGIVKGNETLNTRPREENNTVVAHTGTLTKTTKKTYQAPLATTPRENFSILIQASGYIPVGSTNSTKVIDITINGTIVGQISLAAADVGMWEFETRISKATNTSSIALTKAFADSEANSDNQSATLGINWVTTNVDINIDMTLGNITDTINLTHWVVEYEGAEYNTVT